MDHQKPNNFVSVKGKVSYLKNYGVGITCENYEDSVTHS